MDIKRVVFIVLLAPVCAPLMLLAFVGALADEALSGLAAWLTRVCP